MIPKTIHLIWLQADRPRPDTCINSWAAAHPDWQVKLWSEEDLIGREWINVEAMRQVARRGPAALADLMRWEILYEEGGVAVDADTMCQRSLPEWLLEVDAFACWQNEEEMPGVLSAGFVGFSKDHPLIAQVVLEVRDHPDLASLPTSAIAGSQRLTKAWNKAHDRNLLVLPSYAFMPRRVGAPPFGGAGYVYGCKMWQGLLGRLAVEVQADQMPWQTLVCGQTATPAGLTVAIALGPHCRFAEETVITALAQARSGLDEVVVVDGSPSRASLPFQDPRVRYFGMPGCGPSELRNRLLAEARTEHILWVDGDDLLMPGIVAAYSSFASGWPELSFFYGNLRVDHAASQSSHDAHYEQFFGDGLLLSKQFMADGLPHTGFLARTSAMRAMGGYRAALEEAANQDLWLRAAGQGWTALHVGLTTVSCQWHDARVLPAPDRRAAAELRLMQDALQQHDLPSLCADLPWQEDPAGAQRQACLRVAQAMSARGDVQAAGWWAQRAQVGMLTRDDQVSHAPQSQGRSAETQPEAVA